MCSLAWRSWFGSLEPTWRALVSPDGWSFWRSRLGWWSGFREKRTAISFDCCSLIGNFKRKETLSGENNRGASLSKFGFQTIKWGVEKWSYLIDVGSVVYSWQNGFQILEFPVQKGFLRQLSRWLRFLAELDWGRLFDCWIRCWIGHFDCGVGWLMICWGEFDANGDATSTRSTMRKDETWTKNQLFIGEIFSCALG